MLSNKKNVTETIRLNRKLITFLSCLLISVCFWLMMTYSKEYSISINFPVRYINFPTDKVIATQLPTHIDIEIKSSGFNLLLYKLKNQHDTIILDINDVKASGIKNNFYLLSNSRLDKITEQFNNEIKIIKLYPDSLILNFNKRISKNVKVKPNLIVGFEKEIQVKDSIIINPSFISVSGAEDVLTKINFVETEKINLKNVTKSMRVKLKLVKSELTKLVSFSQPAVEAFIDVSKFTETSIDLPIEVINLPANYSLKTFPDKISVKYNVAFDNFSKINASQFSAIVDFKKTEPGNNKLKVQLIKFPACIRGVRFNPEKVEYIIRK